LALAMGREAAFITGASMSMTTVRARLITTVSALPMSMMPKAIAVRRTKANFCVQFRAATAKLTDPTRCFTHALLSRAATGVART
jgi:hypothetical protein